MKFFIRIKLMVILSLLVMAGDQLFAGKDKKRLKGSIEDPSQMQVAPQPSVSLLPPPAADPLSDLKKLSTAISEIEGQVVPQNNNSSESDIEQSNLNQSSGLWGYLFSSGSTAKPVPPKKWITLKPYQEPQQGAKEERVGTAVELNNLLEKTQYGTFARELRYYLASPGGDVTKNNDLTYALRYCYAESKKLGNPYILFELIRRNTNILPMKYEISRNFVRSNLVNMVKFIYILTSKGCIYQHSTKDEHINYAKKICNLLKKFLAIYRESWLALSEYYFIDFEDVFEEVRTFPSIATLLDQKASTSFAQNADLDASFNDVALAFVIDGEGIELKDVSAEGIANFNKDLAKYLKDDERAVLYPMKKADALITKRCKSWKEFFAFTYENIDLV